MKELCLSFVEEEKAFTTVSSSYSPPSLRTSILTSLPYLSHSPLCHSHCFTLDQELDEVLSSHAAEEQWKKEMLYHKWSERVFSPLHSQLAHTMDSDQWQALATAKGHIYQQYLDYRKRKVLYTAVCSHQMVDEPLIFSLLFPLNVSGCLP